VVVLALGVVAPATAWAQDNYPPSTTVTTGSNCGTSNADPAVCGTGVGGSSASNSSLPFTGGDVALMTVLGVAAAGGGVGLVMLGRRRSRAAA
jgi:hypothetical protein